MTPTEAIEYLLEVYGRPRVAPAMRRFYEAALTGLPPEAIAKAVMAICEEYGKLPTVRQLRIVAALFRPVRQKNDRRPLTADEAWRQAPVLPEAERRQHASEALQLAQRIVRERWDIPRQLEAFRLMHRKYPNCNWGEAVLDAEARLAMRKEPPEVVVLAPRPGETPDARQAQADEAGRRKLAAQAALLRVRSDR